MSKPRSGRLSAASGSPLSGPGKIRIIGGRWRGTRLEVANAPGLRPTSDRVRETLFNWLAPALPGARVLDLFAGSGALGLEAVSRGAQCAVLVERNPALVNMLRTTAAKLPGGDVVSVVQADAAAWLGALADQSFDIAFVDPPFAAGLWPTIVPALLPRLSARGWLYVESPLAEIPVLPACWPLYRHGSTREVRYALYRGVPTADGSPAPADTLPAAPAGPHASPFDFSDQ